MNISNLMTVSAAVTIAVAGTIYSQKSDPVISYYAVTPSGCPVISTPSGCGTTVGATCTVTVDGISGCPVRKNGDAGNPCAIPLYKN